MERPSSFFSVATVGIVAAMVVPPWILIPRDAEIIGAAVLILCWLAGGILSLTFTFVAFYRRERMVWLSVMALFGGLAAVFSLLAKVR